MKRRLATMFLLALTTPLSAQWLSLPTPGIPRTADGEPDLSASTPRTADGHPDLSGLWRPERVRGDLNDQSKYQAWVRALIDEREKVFFAENPRYRCLPAGPDNLTVGNNSYGLRTIMQTPTMIAMLYNDGTYRQIFMDGRALEPDALPTWMGYAVGRWDGDTLVVESNGYNDKTWLGRGASHTEQLRIVERYHRTDFGHIQADVTYEDPGAFESPLHAVIDMEFAADEVMLETVCNEAYGGENGNWSTQVTELEETVVDVAPEILSRYVGTYGGMYLQNSVTMEVTLDNGELFLQKNNGRKARLIPQSDTAFLIGGFGYVFTVDDAGMATEISEVHVSGAWPFSRVR
jgi:hypothetical protein